MSPSSSNQWSDLPRRLLTVSIGVPFIVFLLSTKLTSLIFFQSVHLLCTIEWLKLIPALCASTKQIGVDSGTAEARNDEKNSIIKYNSSSTFFFPVCSFFITTMCQNSDQVLTCVVFSIALLYLSSYIDLVRYQNYNSKAHYDKGETNKHVEKDKMPPRQKCQGTKQEKEKNNNYSNQHEEQRILLSIANSKNHAIHGIVYISLPFYCWMQLSSQSFTHTVFLLFVVWNTDTGALIAGRVSKMLTSSSSASPSSLKRDIVGNLLSKSRYGRFAIQIIQSISPSKSITGFVGGLMFGSLTSIYLPFLMLSLKDSWIGLMLGGMRTNCLILLGLNSSHADTYMDVYQIQENGILNYDSSFIGHYTNGGTNNFIVTRMAIGLILSYTAIIGDLVESSVKRNSGKKDSGKLLPGHGGILDRFDSTFLAVVLYLHCFLPSI